MPPVHAASMNPLSGKCTELKITVTQTDIDNNGFVFVNASNKTLAAKEGLDFDYLSTQSADYGFTHSLCGDTSGGNWWFKATNKTLAAGSYIMIVWGPPYDTACDDSSPNFNYNTCKTTSSYITEIAFTVTSDPAQVIIGREEYFPAAKIITELKGKYLSAEVPVEYEVTDKNDITWPPYGLRKENPAEFFVGKRLLPYNDFLWELLGRAAATGTFLWDTTKIPDGRYLLKLKVWDAPGNFGEETSGEFTIDNTPPQFEVKESPSFTRGEPVEIKIKSSEPLLEIPKLTVSQFRHEPAEVELKEAVEDGPSTSSGNNGELFGGVYQIVDGFDGPAAIAILGVDLAGNKGSAIIGQEGFSVGIKPPPPPVVESPRSETATTTATLSLSGHGINAVKVVTRVNGKDIYETKDIRAGGFYFESIRLDPNFNKGRNSISVTSYDAGGNVSEPTVVDIFLNSPPKIKLVEPLGRRLKFNGEVRVRWDASDINDDKLAYKVELSSNRGSTWKTLAEKLRAPELLWDTTTVPDGSNYMLRVTATDGSLSAYATGPIFALENNLPAIILDSSGDFYLSETKTFSGVVRSKADLLKNLEWSLNQGEDWEKIEAQDGKWDSEFERFDFAIPRIKAGRYNILIRGFTALKRKVANAEEIRIFFDNNRPGLKFQPPQKTTNVPFLKLGGSATDDFSGIESVEYKIEGSGWFKATIETGLGERSAQFKIDHEEKLKDGAHEIILTAVDRAGNRSEESKINLTTDATPPRLGSFIFRSGGNIIFPATDGIMRIESGASISFEIAIAGNPIKTTLLLNNEVAKFQKISTDIRKSDFVFNGEETLVTIEAEDELGNKISREISRLVAGKTTSSKPESFWQKIIRLFD
ncbi:MAG: hypothetical protein AAB897_00230 [Patescibacteria group bacterium]